MRYININNPDDIISAKREVEEILINKKEITEEMSLPDFINFLQLQNTIFVKDDIVIPFKIYNNFIFYVSSADSDDFFKVLKLIKYDLTQLKSLSNDEVYSGELDKHPIYFIIDSKYMVLSTKYKRAE